MTADEYTLVTVSFQLIGSINLPLVALNGEIDLFAGAYAMQRYQMGRKVNSLRSDQYAILNLYRFCASLGIDIQARAANQRPLLINEVEAFAVYCSINHSTKDHTDSAWYCAKYRGGRDFFRYLWLFHRDRASSNLDNLKASEILYARMEAAFDQFKKAPYRTDKKDKIGLTPDLRLKFMSIINPNEPNQLNPWKTQKIRWRNYILLLLLILNGNRKGETLLLKLNHFQLTGRRKYYDIFKAHSKDVYPRMDSPSVKTFGRQVELHDDFAALIEFYITKIRGQFVNAHTTSYVFLSYRDGLPLAIHTPNAILNDVVSMFPEFTGVLSPHRLRNTFHDVLNTALDKKFKFQSSLSRQMAKQPIQESAGGWAHNSQMPQKYAKGDIQRRVAEFQLQIQELLLEQASQASHFQRGEQ